MSFLGNSPASTKPPEPTMGNGGGDPSLSLKNLAAVHARMDTLQKFLSVSVNSNTLISKDHMGMVSSEITSAIHQIIVNGAALLACSHTTDFPSVSFASESTPVDTSRVVVVEKEQEKLIDPKFEIAEDEMSDGYEILELDAVELLAEHVHFCEICGKGFKRDANLRMHMRAHGNQFKTPAALAKPEKCGEPGTLGGVLMRKMRFSCPYVGCNRNKQHKKFRPLKSAICVKNHFKRSHCPKMYSCSRCKKKSFSVLADLKSHLKHCGETRWKCSCGTSFSRKDKLFGHMALFEGHMPAVVEEEEDGGEKGKGAVVMVEDDEDVDSNPALKEMEIGMDIDNGFFDGLLDGFDSIDNYSFQDLLSSPNAAANTGMDGFNF